MLKDLDLNNVLVLDIETVSGKGSFADLDEVMQSLWQIKSDQIQNKKPVEERLTPEQSYTEMAGIYAEFGKIVCISVGAFRRNKETGEWNYYVKSYFHHDERQLLMGFAKLLHENYPSSKVYSLCGHNIKEFDVPYICRRMIINRVPLPDLLDIAGKKPWEVNNIDTMDYWKFGDYKSFTALKLLCGVFGIPTPKDDIDGSQVGPTYWQEKDLRRIETYCRKDIIATAQVLLSFRMEPILEEHQIILRDQSQEDIGEFPFTKLHSLAE